MGQIAILGVFVADTAYRAERMPRMGETILGNGFALGPGGKGSNQAVAAARAGGEVRFVSKLGRDAFAEMAFSVWADAGVVPAVARDGNGYTGAAYIFLEESTGDNAIIVCPGAGGTISPADVEAERDTISGADVFATQLEQPMDAARRALEIAREGGAMTILDPAPAATIPEEMFALCDWVTPNETEAEQITGIPVASLDDAARAGRAFMEKGAGAAAVTLGARGVMLTTNRGETHVPAFEAGLVVETTGAGDAFNGAFAVGLAEGASAEEAARFGCACAALSVTRPGTAASMPARGEIDALLSRR